MSDDEQEEEEKSLLAAIHASAPDNDEAHLVYADWLLDRNDPRGELIQIQCRLARQEDAKLRARERELLKEHQLSWLGTPYDENMTWVFDRGFPTGRVGHLGVYVGYAPEGSYGYARFFPDGTFITVRTAEPSDDTLEKIARWFHPEQNACKGTYAITFTPGQRPHVEATASQVKRDSWPTDYGEWEEGEEYTRVENYSGELAYDVFRFAFSGKRLIAHRDDSTYRRKDSPLFDSRLLRKISGRE